MFPKKILERKEKLKPNTLIVGPKRVGKSFLVFKFLKNFKGKYKIIDFEDFKELDFNFHGIDLLIVENYDFQIELPKMPMIVTSPKNIYIKGMNKINLFNLDFEEFFFFSNSISPETAFDKFLKQGNFPRIFNEDYFKEEYLKETIKLLPYHQEILKFFLGHIGEKLTLYQIYQILKKEIKLSKDFFYKEVENLINDKVIFEIPKYNSPKSPKKFFAYNFAFKNVLTNRKNIQYTFENIVYLEIKKPCFYTDKITFYFPDEEKGVIVMPFASKEIVEERVKNIDIPIEIITISNEFEVEKKNVEVIPFYKWSLAK